MVIAETITTRYLVFNLYSVTGGLTESNVGVVRVEGLGQGHLSGGDEGGVF